ncbi:hydrolase tropI [Colletotrichum liriopes]|uniref:Hydrolase tropI n=1 Tax=Colletotrichum liriopes TaxID=708192 RepID=A0AA37GM27_9PEZI|nr:hydrolase tropI [Colletotrichum liriopes]
MLSQMIVTALLGFASLATAAKKCPVADVSAIAHTGTPVGKEVSYNGLTQYVSKPKGWSARGNKTTGVLYLTDVFGIQLAQNKLLADSFARAGYVSVAPDLFNGSPAPNDINIPGFNTTQFLAQHGPNVTDPIIANSIKYLREELRVDKVAVTGIASAVAIRSVSLPLARVLMSDLPRTRVCSPTMRSRPLLAPPVLPQQASALYMQTDNLMSPARRAEVETLLSETGQPFSVALYGGTSHGFAVRANISDPRQKFGKEEAFFQAVRFFDTWA